MSNPVWLQVAYASNVLILIPCVLAMFWGNGIHTVFQGKVADSAGLRLLVGSLWTAILLASIAGLRWPAYFAPVVLLQIAYKLMWLAAFVLPLVVARRHIDVPWGISITFAIIVPVYSLLFWRAC